MGTVNLKILNIKKPQWLLIYLILALLTAFALAPLYLAVVSSFRPEKEVFSHPGNIFYHMTLRNYIELFTNTFYLRWFLNSTFVAAAYTILVLFFSSLGGFAFAKYKFVGKKTMFLIVIGSMTIPVWAIVLPLYFWFSQIGLIDTYWALILPASASPFGIFLMRQYIHGIPNDMIESARIDGCNEFQIYYKIILPVIKPAIGALAIYAFLFSWNDFIGPLIYIRDPQLFTLPVGLASFVGSGTAEQRYSLLMAGSILSFLPIGILFLKMQKQFIAGLTLGAVKE